MKSKLSRRAIAALADFLEFERAPSSATVSDTMIRAQMLSIAERVKRLAGVTHIGLISEEAWDDAEAFIIDRRTERREWRNKSLRRQQARQERQHDLVLAGLMSAS